MQKKFIELYEDIDKSKKLNFLKQLLLKDSDLQQQFLQFTVDKKADLDSITAIDIEELRDEIWGEISAIDPDSEVENSCYYHHYENEELGDDLLTAIFNPYTVKTIDFAHKGNYLDAFRIILAIYELKLIETPEIDDDNYFVFNDEIDSYIDGFIFSSIAKFNTELKHKVLSVEMVHLLQELFFERYIKSEQDAEYEIIYNISHFKRFFEHIVDNAENARSLLENIDKALYENLYIRALEIYVVSEQSIEHYTLLREYLDMHKRVAFIKNFEEIYNKLFYVQLLEIEKQYGTILKFVAQNRHSYDLHALVKPIVSIYPNEVFDILKIESDKQVNARGRSSYARASQLLQLMLIVPEKRVALKAYVSKLYNHQPRLPALRDELGKAGLLK